jgi:hypothetical protein
MKTLKDLYNFVDKELKLEGYEHKFILEKITELEANMNSGLKILYQELLERREGLKSNDSDLSRIDELLIITIRVQQLLLDELNQVIK